MAEWLSFFFVALSAVFVVVDPIAAVPMFLSMTADRPADDVQRIVRRAAWVGAALLAFFTLFGGLLFEVLHVELAAFRVAGGLLLLLTALDMLRARPSSCRCSGPEIDAAKHKEDVSIVPLATPILAGPGSIATVMVLMADRGSLFAAVPVLLAIALTFAVAFLVFTGARKVARFLNPSVMALVQRVMGLILAAVAVQFIATGGRELLSGWESGRL